MREKNLCRNVPKFYGTTFHTNLSHVGALGDGQDFDSSLPSTYQVPVLPVVRMMLGTKYLERSTYVGNPSQKVEQHPFEGRQAPCIIT